MTSKTTNPETASACPPLTVPLMKKGSRRSRRGLSRLSLCFDGQPPAPRTTPLSTGDSSLDLDGHIPDAFASRMLRTLRDGNAGWISLLVFINLVYFGDALFSSNTFFFRDVSFFHYPLKRLVTEAYARGEWPLWNPYLQLGQPLLANPNSMAVYPTQLLFHLLPFQTAYELHFVLHSILAGISAYYLASALGLKRHCAFLTAAVYNFSGTTLSFLNLFNILPVIVFLPLLTLAVIRLLQAPSFTRVACSSWALALFLIAVEPTAALTVGFFLAPLAVAFYFFGEGPKTSLRTAAFTLGLTALSGLLLAAVQLLPTLELTRNSGRQGGLSFEIVSFWSLHPLNLMQAVFPSIFGDIFKLHESMAWAKALFDKREPYLLSCYVGILPLFLAAWGLTFWRRRWLALTLGGIAAWGLLLALGKHFPLFHWLFEFVPLFRYGRFPVKYLLIANLCGALLAGLALESLEAMRDKLWKSKRIALAVAVLLGAMVFCLGLERGRFWTLVPHVTPSETSVSLSFRGETYEIARPLISRAIGIAQLHLGAILLLLGLMAWRLPSLAVARFCLFSFVLYDFFLGTYWINPLTSEELYDPPPVVLFLQSELQKGELFRVQTAPLENQDAPIIHGSTNSIVWGTLLRRSILSELLAAKDHIQFGLYNPVDRMETKFLQLVNSEFRLLQTTEEKIQLLAGLNVKYVLSLNEIKVPQVELVGTEPVNGPQPLRIYRLRSSLPRAFLVDASRVESSGPDFSFSQTISRSSQEAQHSASDVKAEPEPAIVEITEYGANRVVLKAAAQRPSTLVLLDSFYPGWRATLDGRDVPIRRVNYVFRGVEISSGNHHLVFEYCPQSFYAGLWISGVTALAWLGVLVARSPLVVKRKHAS